MAGRFWREAATLIIVGRNGYTASKSSRQYFDYNLLFLKRSQKSSFMPSAFVFPGGVVENSDFSVDWLNVFQKCGYTADDLLKQFRNKAPLPEIYNNKPSDILLPEIGFRIAAIRETFEECGFLMTSHLSKEKFAEIDLKSWRKAVYDDASQFLSLFCEFGGCPAVWELHEWSGWLTPSHQKKRYDTAFYVTFVDEISNIASDRSEIETFQVSSPKDILDQWVTGSLLLPPPQAYEMSRFLRFSQYDDLKKFAEARGKKGLPWKCPVTAKAIDGILSLYPGDDLYPKASDHTEDEIIFYDSTMLELRNTAKNLHRAEISSPKDIYFVTNIKPKYDHITPLNYRDFDDSMSKL